MIDSRYIWGFALGVGGIFFAFLFAGLLDCYTLKGFREWLGALSGWVAGGVALAVGLPTVRAVSKQANILEKQTHLLERNAKRPFMEKKAAKLKIFKPEVQREISILKQTVPAVPIGLTKPHQKVQFWCKATNGIKKTAFEFAQPQYGMPGLVDVYETLVSYSDKFGDLEFDDPKEAKEIYIKCEQALLMALLRLADNIQRELNEIDLWLTTPEDTESNS